MAKRRSRRAANPARKPEKRQSQEVRPVVAVLQQSMANPFEPMEKLMQAFMPWLKPWGAVTTPAPKLDVIDRDDEVLVRAEVPGVDKGKLAVEASDTYVTIKGRVQQDAQRDEQHYTIAETRRGEFERTVSLPSDVDSTKATARFRDGVVEVMLPKVDRSRAHHVKL